MVANKSNKSTMPPPAPRKPRKKVVRKLHRRDATAGFVKNPRDLFKKSVGFAGHDNVVVFDRDTAPNAAAIRTKWVSKARQDELLVDALQSTEDAYKASLVSKATEIDFERSFNKMLREQGYSGRGRTCAAALAMGTVRKLARNAEVAISMSECLLDLFKEQKLEAELVSKIGDLCFIHNDAMTAKEHAAVRQYMCDTM